MNAAIAALTKAAPVSSKTSNAANSETAGNDQASFGALLGRTIDAHRSADATDPATAPATDATAAVTTDPNAAQDASAALLQALAALGLVPGQNAVATQGAATRVRTDTDTTADEAGDAATAVAGRGRLPADPGLGAADAKPRAGKTDLAANGEATRDATQAARTNAKAALAAAAIEGDAKTATRADAASTDKPVATFADVLNTLAATASTASNASTSTSQTPVAQHSLDTRFGSTQWADDLTDKVRHFVLQKIEVAELKLNPQDLGPIRVEIALDQGNAAIHFSAARDDVRDALAQNIGNLRTALADAGVALQNASTGSFGDGQAFAFMQRQQASDGAAARGTGSGQAREADTAPAISATTAARPSNASANGVDLFA